MPKLKKTLADNTALEGMVIASFERMFIQYQKEPQNYFVTLGRVAKKVGRARAGRSGLHASAIIAEEGGPDKRDSFCYREQVMQFYWPVAEEQVSPVMRRVFLEGNSIHIKWQALFTLGGYALSVEDTRRIEEYDLSYTPDAIVRIMNRIFVVEIKSMRTELFRRLKSPPKSAVKQLRFYMRQLRTVFDEPIYGIVLVEDKNDQEYKLWIVEHDDSQSREHIKRMHLIKRAREIYESDGRLPRRLCQSKDDKRAQNCPLRKPCFRIP